MAQPQPLDPAAYRRPVYAACVWCSGTDLTNEDVIPNWLRRKFLVLPNSTHRVILTQENRSIPVGQPKKKRGFGLKIRAVCRTCNSGWMSELEKRARPHLDPLVEGVTIRITPVAKEAVATWAMKTAMMLGFRFGKPPSPHLARWFMENQEPNRNSVVWIGYLNPGPQLVGIDGIDHGETHGFVAGLGLGGLALLVILRLTFDSTVLPAYEDVLFEVWPIDLQGIDWPPPLGISTTHLNVAKVSLRKLIRMGCWRS